MPARLCYFEILINLNLKLKFYEEDIINCVRNFDIKLINIYGIKESLQDAAL